jgi:lipopolysaccharide transport system permease protein
MSITLDSRVARRVDDTVLDLTADMSLLPRLRLAADDVIGGLRLARLAWTLGWLDIRLRYRGSLLGPLWLTLSTAVMVTSLGVLYATLFHMNVHDYLPFLALSQVLWSFLATQVAEACTCFTAAEGIIRTVRMPLFLHALRSLVRNALVLGHNVIVIVGVDIIFNVWPGWHAMLCIPGLVLWTIDSLAVALLLGAFCARFRDIGPIVGSVMQIAFFMTPVIWKPEQLGRHIDVLPFNPFYALLEVVRAPLLGTTANLPTYAAAVIYSVLLCVLSALLFARARGRLAFWL